MGQRSCLCSCWSWLCFPGQGSLWEPWPCVRIRARAAGLAPRAAAEEREGDGLAGGWELGAVGWEGAPGVSGWG